MSAATLAALIAVVGVLTAYLSGLFGGVSKVTLVMGLLAIRGPSTADEMLELSHGRIGTFTLGFVLSAMTSCGLVTERSAPGTRAGTLVKTYELSGWSK